MVAKFRSAIRKLLKTQDFAAVFRRLPRRIVRSMNLLIKSVVWVACAALGFVVRRGLKAPSTTISPTPGAISMN